MKFPKINLQLFADGENTTVFGFDTGVANPLFTDDAPTDSGENNNTTTNSGNNSTTNSGDNTNIPTHSVDNDTQFQQPSKPKNFQDVDFTEIKNKLDTILNRVDKPIDIPQEPSINNAPPQLSEEEIEQLNNDFYLKFTEKPFEAIQEMINQRAEEIADKQIAPIREHFESMQKVEAWKKQIDEFEATHPDFKEMVNDISQIIQSDESIRNSRNPLELAYKVAKADKFEQNNIPISEQLKDPGTLKELLKNPEIKNMLFNELKNNNQVIPQVIGSTGQTSVNVGDKPKSMSDATKAWLNS